MQMTGSDSDLLKANDHLVARVTANVIKEDQLPPDTPPSSYQELLKWVAGGHCSLEALAEAERRAATMRLYSGRDLTEGVPVREPPTKIVLRVKPREDDTRILVAESSWAIRFPHAGKWEVLSSQEQTELDTQFDVMEVSAEIELDAVRLRTIWDAQPVETRDGFPLTPIVRAWLQQPLPSPVSSRQNGRIIPARLAMAKEGERRAPRLYSPAAHTTEDGQGVLPGFGVHADTAPTIALPLELYAMGGGTDITRGRGVPLCLRMFVGSVLAVPQNRRDGRPIALTPTLREFLSWVYPNGVPGKSVYWPRMMAAANALDTTWIPVYDAMTNRHGMRRVVKIDEIPRGPGCLDDTVGIVVWLPAGSENGPQVSDNLHRWGTTNAAAYRLLLNLAYHLHRPGVSLRPAGPRNDGGGKYWAQSQHPDDYDPLTSAEITAMAFPGSKRRNRRELASDALKALHTLAAHHEVQVTELGHGQWRVMPVGREVQRGTKEVTTGDKKPTTGDAHVPRCHLSQLRQRSS